eukprot:g5924.t1
MLGSVSRDSTGSYLDASRGFAWSCSQLRSLVQTRGWTQACPTEVVALLGNAYLNHAESLRLLIWTSHTDPAQSQNYSLEGFTNAAKHVRQKVEQTGAHSEQTGAHSVQSSSASPRASLEQLESVYLQALACHLRASHRALASAELVAFTVHQLVVQTARPGANPALPCTCHEVDARSGFISYRYSCIIRLQVIKLNALCKPIDRESLKVDQNLSLTECRPWPPDGRDRIEGRF